MNLGKYINFEEIRQNDPKCWQIKSDNSRNYYRHYYTRWQWRHLLLLSMVSAACAMLWGNKSKWR